MLGYVPLNSAGGTMTGPLITAISTTAGAGLNCPQGTAPSAPNNGDIWCTSAGVFARISGGTVGPFGSGGGGGTPGGTNGQVQINNSGAFGGITNTQLTALVNQATISLPGTVPAYPNTLTTFLRGDFSWSALPTATSSSLGIVQPDNSSIVISAGVLSAPGSGGGTVSSCAQYSIGAWTGAGTTNTINCVAPAANAILATSGSNVPSLSTSLPTGIGINAGTATWTGVVPLANGGTGLSSGTSGGIPCYTATGTLVSSALLAANGLVKGGGSGVCPSTIATANNGVMVTNGSGVPAIRNALAGDFYFGSGRPWTDIRSGANGCAAAVGNNSNDDTTAIQCQITYVGGIGGGVVFFPCGNYKTTSQMSLGAGVFLVGQGLNCSLINGSAGNFQMIDFTGNYSGMDGIFVLSNDTSSATQATVLISPTTVGVQIKNSYIWGGIGAIQANGIDCYLENNFIGAAPAANSISLYLHGGVCKVIGNKIDPPTGGGVSYGVIIDNVSSGGTAVVENILIGNDISGYTTNSVYIDDSADTSGRTLITSLVANIFGAPVNIHSAKSTTISNGELAGNITIGGAGGPVSVSGVMAVSGSSWTATGAICAANINITC